MIGVDKTNQDISRLLGNAEYTWDEFYEALNKAKKENDKVALNQAVLMAGDLLAGRIYGKSYQSDRTNSETIYDYTQDAYVVIMEHILDYDETKDTSFATFMDRWFEDIARKSRNQGIPEYQKRKKGAKVISIDETLQKLNDNQDMDGKGVSEATILPAMKSAEDVYEERIVRRTQQLYKQAMETSDDKKQMYVAMACLTKCLGGISEYPEEVQDYLSDKMKD